MPREDYSHSYSPHGDRDREYRYRSDRRHRSKSPDSDFDASRSRSGDRDDNQNRGRDRHRTHRHRSRSRPQDRRSRSSHRHGHRPKPTKSPTPTFALPHNARRLTKYDLEEYYNLFADYLDIQKGLAIEDLDKAELKGRFKSFVGHWNRGELAKGWYDPLRRRRNSNSVHKQIIVAKLPISSEQRDVEDQVKEDEEETESSSDEDIVGPALPGREPSRYKARVTLPTKEDLDLQREQAEEDVELAREQLRHARQLDRKLQKERLEELVPRADPGSRERKLEKKNDLNEKMRLFRDKSPGAGLEVSEDMLMGGGTDSFKAMKAAKNRKKNERELRKEAILRQRIEEREARLQRHREKEEKTVMMLKAMAENSMYAKRQSFL